MQALNYLRLELQWGRGFEAAETRPSAVLIDDSDELQWGRGFEAAETESEAD